MAWWKADPDIFESKIMKLIESPTHKRDQCVSHRALCFLKLLFFSCREQCFLDAADLSRSARVSKHQASVVWDICIAEDVLRPTADGEGYSALEWMVERGYFGDGRSPEQHAASSEPPPFPPKGGGGGEVQNRNSFININREVT